MGIRLHLCPHLAGSAAGGFVIDVFTRRIVGWRVRGNMRTDFVLDTLEQALTAA